MQLHHIKKSISELDYQSQLNLHQIVREKRLARIATKKKSDGSITKLKNKIDKMMVDSNIDYITFMKVVGKHLDINNKLE